MMNDLTMDPAFGRYRPSWRICVIELIEIETIGPSCRSYDHKYNDYCFFLLNRHLNTHNLLDNAKKHNVALQRLAQSTYQRSRLPARPLQRLLDGGDSSLDQLRKLLAQLCSVGEVGRTRTHPNCQIPFLEASVCSTCSPRVASIAQIR